MSTEIAGLFDRWNESLMTLDPDEVVNNYSNDAVLVPTLSNVIRTNKESIKEYFVEFLKKHPTGKINDSVVKVYGDIAIHSGIYTFSFDLPEGVETATARFSFSYRKQNGKWEIIEHHSSLMPETVH